MLKAGGHICNIPLFRLAVGIPLSLQPYMIPGGATGPMATYFAENGIYLKSMNFESIVGEQVSGILCT